MNGSRVSSRLVAIHLSLTKASEIDYSTADPALLVQLADASEAVLLIVHIGTSAVGRLLARAATEPVGSEEFADAVEALGWLVTELNDLAIAVRRVAGKCRQHTSDYAPATNALIPLARP